MTAIWGKCSTCGDYTFVPHKCAPVFEWRTKHMDDWERVHAYDPQTAAEIAAKIYDQEDYYLIRNQGTTIPITIRDQRTQEVTIWDAEGESRPHYSARRQT